MIRARLIKAKQTPMSDADRDRLDQEGTAANAEPSPKAQTPEEIVSGWAKTRQQARQVNPRALFDALFSAVRG